jgi:hypothetical protein
MTKTFAYAGTCVVDGATVYKFANNANRAAELVKFGATEVNMVTLPEAMDKEAAVAYLRSIGIEAGTVIRTVKNAKGERKTVKIKVTRPAVKSKSEPDLQEQYGEEMFERKANGMPTLTFAQWKRGRETVAKWFAKHEQKLQAKRDAGKWFA